MNPDECKTNARLELVFKKYESYICNVYNNFRPVYCASGTFSDHMSAPSKYLPLDVGHLRTGGVLRGAPVTFTLDGQPVVSFAGESVAAALWAGGRRELRHSPRADLPRGMFCMMGSCQECLVWVGVHKLPSCQVPVSDGLAVESLPHRERLHG